MLQGETCGGVFMCRQAIACILLIAGLILLLMCFMPTWIICVLGVLLILAGIAIIALRLMRRH